MGIEFFKDDIVENKAYNSASPILSIIGADLDDFFTNAYSNFLLGELLYDSGRVPLSNAIPRDVFRESYNNILNNFLLAGTFEAYISVFTDIFGDTVDVQFTVPAPGRLQIAIIADSVVQFDFETREISGNSFVNNDIEHRDDPGDVDSNILFQLIKGFTSEYEVEQMLFELVPSGIFTEITLTLGS